MYYEWCIIREYEEQDTAFLYGREENLEDCTKDGKVHIVESRGPWWVQRRRRIAIELIKTCTEPEPQS